eukprot:m.178827 g.178827  ORF g.178827 m.178827 type:complete len:784 (-) comp16597_c1_seq3:1549-3900(-)
MATTIRSHELEAAGHYARKVLQQADKAGNGWLSKTELKRVMNDNQGLKNLLLSNGGHYSDIWAALDPEQNGRINLQDLIQFMEEKQSLSQNQTRAETKGTRPGLRLESDIEEFLNREKVDPEMDNDQGNVRTPDSVSFARFLSQQQGGLEKQPKFSHLDQMQQEKKHREKIGKPTYDEYIESLLEQQLPEEERQRRQEQRSQEMQRMHEQRQEALLAQPVIVPHKNVSQTHKGERPQETQAKSGLPPQQEKHPRPQGQKQQQQQEQQALEQQHMPDLTYDEFVDFAVQGDQESDQSKRQEQQRTAEFEQQTEFMGTPVHMSPPARQQPLDLRGHHPKEKQHFVEEKQQPQEQKTPLPQQEHEEKKRQEQLEEQKREEQIRRQKQPKFQNLRKQQQKLEKEKEKLKERLKEEPSADEQREQEQKELRKSAEMKRRKEQSRHQHEEWQEGHPEAHQRRTRQKHQRQAHEGEQRDKQQQKQQRKQQQKQRPERQGQHGQEQQSVPAHEERDQDRRPANEQYAHLFQEAQQPQVEPLSTRRRLSWLPGRYYLLPEAPEALAPDAQLEYIFTTDQALREAQHVREREYYLKEPGIRRAKPLAERAPKRRKTNIFGLVSAVLVLGFHVAILVVGALVALATGTLSRSPLRLLSRSGKRPESSKKATSWFQRGKEVVMSWQKYPLVHRAKETFLNAGALVTLLNAVFVGAATALTTFTVQALFKRTLPWSNVISRMMPPRIRHVFIAWNSMRERFISTIIDMMCFLVSCYFGVMFYLGSRALAIIRRVVG